MNMLQWCYLLCYSVAGGVMDITAFEYIRKFSTPLNLGECPRREVSVPTGAESRDVERQAW